MASDSLVRGVTSSPGGDDSLGAGAAGTIRAVIGALADLGSFVAQRFSTLVERGETYVFLLPIYVVMLTGERALHELRRRPKWDDRDGAANVTITVVSLLKDLWLGHLLPLAILAWLYGHARLFTLPAGGAGLLAAFVLYDLCWYVDHRIAHRTGLFWAFHQVHHSSREFNFTVASRGFLLDSFATRPLFYLLPVLGVSPSQYISIQILTNIFGIFQHTRLIRRLGPIDGVLATPSNHRVHHGSNSKYLDRNYGEVLIVWDRLFGTFTREEEEPVFGLTKNIDTYNPISIEISGIRWLVDRMRSAKHLSDKIRYLWMPPEWRHDGEDG